MVLRITHFTSVEANRNFYFRFTTGGYWDDEFKEQLKKMRGFPPRESRWIESYLWADNKKGAWRVSERVWDLIIHDFENGVQVNNDEHDRIAKINKEARDRDEEFMRSQGGTYTSPNAGMGGYTADFIEGIMAAFAAGNDERLKREAAWRSQGYWVPRSGVFMVEIVEEEAPPPAPPQTKMKTDTPDQVAPSDHLVVPPVQTVDEALGILGLKRNPDHGDAKKAYRRLAMQYAPDRNPGNREYEAKMMRLNMARDIVWRVFSIR